ncbi:MAG: tol-pal system protein YbgF [Gammaproteobacteria bacterium]|jgi:tol-pal system protein YbgF
MIRHGSWLLALVVMSSTASAQSTRERLDALESRVTQTEQLLQGSALAELSTRIDQLESQLRALRGELETQANEQAALRKQLTDLAGELDRRLVAAPVPVAVPATVATASPPAAAAPAAAAAAAAATSPASTAPKAAPAAAEPDTLGPVQRYQLAFEALRAADYPKAIAGFDDMIARYPDHALATNARYWLGRSLVLQQDHARAVDAFAAALAGPLESARVPDAMLRKAQSELQLGRRDAASATLQQLIERFPDSEPARQARGLLTQAGTAR